jgi:hypothetical protein
MGYRFLVALFAVIVIAIGSCFVCCMSGCAAFDSDNTPYVGFDPDIVPVIPGGVAGIHSGFYTGTVTLDSNTCAGLEEEVGTSKDFAVDVIHVDNYINMTFEDGTVAAGEVEGDGVIFMQKDGSTEEVYYLTFSDEEETISGSLEFIEPNEDGQYADPCAVYTVTMEEGEKPENFGTGEVVDETVEEEVVEGEEEEAPEGDVTIPWEMPGAPNQ